MPHYARVGKSALPGSDELQSPHKEPSKHTVGLVAPFSSDLVRSPYLGNLISGIVDELLRQNCHLQWFMIRDNYIPVYDLNFLMSQNKDVGGYLILCWRHFTKLIAQLEKRTDIPVVTISDFHPNLSLSNIYCDNRAGVKQVWDYFVSKKYSPIGMARGPEYISPDARERFEEFSACAEKAGIPLHKNHMYESNRFDEDAGYHMMQLWIKKGDLPRAIFCANDDLAKGSIRAFKERNIKVPEDIAVVGFDGSPSSELLDPPLTTVCQPLYEIGAASVNALVRLVEKKEAPPLHLKFDPKLVIRKSA